jgi:glycerol-3-phosphate dehydrogenase (NAD(P)+)
MQENKRRRSPQGSVLGAGAWGTAVAMALAQRHDVLLLGPARPRCRHGGRAKTPTCPAILPERLQVAAISTPLAHVAEPGSLLIAACPVAGCGRCCTR